jgi:hypothetical protein
MTTAIMKNCDCCCDLPLDRLKGGGATNGQILIWNAAAGEWLPSDLTLDKINQSGATDGQVPTWREGGWVAETLPEPPPSLDVRPPNGSGDCQELQYDSETGEEYLQGSGLTVRRETETGKAKLTVNEPGGGALWGTLRFSGDITLPEDLAGTGGVTDHGALTGLADDDHPQYHTDARGDERYQRTYYIEAWALGELEEAIILLHPLHNGTPLNNNMCFGVLDCWRGNAYALNRKDTCTINAGSAYYGNKYNLYTQDGFRLATASYGGVLYLGVVLPLGSKYASYGGIRFTGWWVSSNGLGLIAKGYNNYNFQTRQWEITNQEIYSSLNILSTNTHVLAHSNNLATLIPQALGAPKAVGGSRSGGTALSNLLTALDQLGLIDNQTTA